MFFMIRVEGTTPAHVHFIVFAGQRLGFAGNAGSLIMRHEEFVEFVRHLDPEYETTPEDNILEKGNEITVVT